MIEKYNMIVRVHYGKPIKDARLYSFIVGGTTFYHNKFKQPFVTSNFERIRCKKLMQKYDNKNDNIHINEVQNIGFGIPIKFPSQRKKNIQIGPETTKLD